LLHGSAIRARHGGADRGFIGFGGCGCVPELLEKVGSRAVEVRGAPCGRVFGKKVESLEAALWAFDFAKNYGVADVGDGAGEQFTYIGEPANLGLGWFARNHTRREAGL
jgi:hypothetical protein